MYSAWKFVSRSKLRKRKRVSKSVELNKDLKRSFSPYPKLDMKVGKLQNFLTIDMNLDLKKTKQKEVEKHKMKALERRKRRNNPLFLPSLDVGFNLVTPIISCLILGLLLDNIYTSKPFFTFLLLFLGIIGSFYNLFKFVRENRL